MTDTGGDQSPTLGARLRALTVDLAPLRTSKDFRRIFAAESISTVGSMATFVAIPIEVKLLTGSYLAVGSIGAVELVPLIVFGLWGGVLADSIDRKALAQWCNVAMAAASLLLVVNAVLGHPSLWPLYVAAAAFATFDALQQPSLQAMVPKVLPHDQLAAAASLQMGMRTIATVAGPALGGIAAATFGPASCFAADLVSFLVALVLLRGLEGVSLERAAERPSLAKLVDGLRFAGGRRDLLGSYLVDLVAMIFAFPYALFPFVADRYHERWVLGALYAAIPAGAMVASLTSGWTRSVHRDGRAIAMAAMAWGLAITAFGLSSALPVVLLALVAAGAADAISAVFRQRMWNSSIPDTYRGRLAGIELLSYSTGPSLGQLRSAAIAKVTSLRFSIVSGGIICVLGAGACLVAFGPLARFDQRTDPNVAAVKASRDA